jgi:hypothetical protein
MTEEYRPRLQEDAVACMVHAFLVVMLVGLLVQDTETARWSLGLLAGMEILALGAHVLVVRIHKKRKNKDYHNQIKWVEYGFTAVAGALAIMVRGKTTPTYEMIYWIVGLSVASGVQQLVCGNIVDANSGKRVKLLGLVDRTVTPRDQMLAFGVASVLQVAEFIGVYVAADKGDGRFESIYFLYVAWWASFGFLAFAFLNSDDRCRKERWYSRLGWIAKSAVVIVSIVDVTSSRDDDVKWASIATSAVGVVALLMLFATK